MPVDTLVKCLFKMSRCVSVLLSSLHPFLSFRPAPPPAQPPGLVAAQGQWRHGAAHLFHVPHRPLPLHVLGVRSPLWHPAVQRALPPAAVRQPGQLLHPGPTGLLVRPALPQGLPPLSAQPMQERHVSHFCRHRQCQGRVISSQWITGLVTLLAANATTSAEALLLLTMFPTLYRDCYCCYYCSTPGLPASVPQLLSIYSALSFPFAANLLP